ncbi:pyrroloquinoline quinone precursor peptide PqqA [Thauera linaloolentis]|nr:pyrroloquinoline quinone precursor peptide PqqA [Thauera linaloolentis]
MKIASAASGFRRCRPAPPSARYASCPAGFAGIAPGATRYSDHIRRHAMQWETPTAVDMRFGFEITMYIATR